MTYTATEWIGNRVALQPLGDSRLTLIQWYRPWNGTFRGAHVVDDEELMDCMAALAEERTARRHRRHDLAAEPAVLESLFGDVLGR